MAWSAKQFTKRGVSADAGIRHGFRSGLEAKNADWIEAHHQPVLFEQFRIPYLVPEHLRHYTPDFELANGIIVETKGIFDTTDRAKHLLVKNQWPELDIRFVFSRAAAKINPGSKTSLGDWATAFGYRWAEKLIPMSWLTEPGPPIKPRVILGRTPK